MGVNESSAVYQCHMTKHSKFDLHCDEDLAISHSHNLRTGLVVSAGKPSVNTTRHVKCRWSVDKVQDVAKK